MLIADSDVRLVSRVKEMARLADYDVETTTSGRDLLALAASLQPALIVLDIKLPDADGRDLLRELKKDVRLANTPVVVWSGRDYESDRDISLDLGANAYLPKHSLHSLLAEVERLLRGPRAG